MEYSFIKQESHNEVLGAIALGAIRRALKNKNLMPGDLLSHDEADKKRDLESLSEYFEEQFAKDHKVLLLDSRVSAESLLTVDDLVKQVLVH